MEDLYNLYRTAVLTSDKEKVWALKRQLLPTKLYRYRCFDSHWYSNIVKGKVYMGSPKHFNDPFDCALPGYGKSLFNSILKIPSQTEIHPSEAEDYVVLNAKGERKPFSELLAEHQNSFKDLFRVACFSERLDSLPMWAHYAANHTGYVIEYDLSKIPTDEITFLYKVAYLSGAETASLDCSTNPPAPFCILLQKGAEWSYEEEWRMIKTNDFPEFVDLSSCISAVYLGANFDKKRNQDEISVIQDHLATNGAELREMYIANFGCAMMYRPL